MNGLTTCYALNLTVGLTQVLAEDSYTYLYGNGCIAQYGVKTTEYFLGNALDSVQQRVDY